MSILFVILFVLLVLAGIFFSLGIRDDERHGWIHFSFMQGVPYWVGSLVFLALSLSFVQVGSGSIGVVTRWGRAISQIGPGAHLIVPIAEDVWPIAVQTRIVHPNENAASHDLQVVHTEVTLAYHLDPNYALYIFTNLNNDAETRIINPAILEAIKAVTAKYDAQQLITERPAVRDGIEDFVKGRIAPYHIIAETTSITDLDFSNDFNQAIELKVTAEQNAEKAKNDLTRIQVEAQQKIAQAQGEAEALKSQKEQITPELLQLRTIEMMDRHWDGHFPQTMAGSSLPMLDILKASNGK